MTNDNEQGEGVTKSENLSRNTTSMILYAYGKYVQTEEHISDPKMKMKICPTQREVKIPKIISTMVCCQQGNKPTANKHYIHHRDCREIRKSFSTKSPQEKEACRSKYISTFTMPYGPGSNF